MSLPDNRELRELLDEATPGTWYTCGAGINTTHEVDDNDRVFALDWYWEEERANREEDFALAALAPQLAEEVIRLREEIDRVKELCLNKCRSAEAAEDSASKGAGLYLEGQQVAYYEAYLQLDKALHGEKQRD